MPSVIRVKRGLTLPIQGRVNQPGIEEIKPVSRIAWCGTDLPGQQFRLLVKEGDQVQIGSPLVADKTCETIHFPSFGAGEVVAVNRGERRRLLSIVIEINESGTGAQLEKKFPVSETMSGAALQQLLLESGLWTMLRQRPYDSVANPSRPGRSLFVTAMDSNPLAPDVALIIKSDEESFRVGLRAVSTLVDGPTFVCVDVASTLSDMSLEGEGRVRLQAFSGKHPVGNVGTHIHFLDPVRRDRRVWHIMAQDVMAIGSFLRTGRFPIEKVVSLAGPGVKHPRLIRLRRGAFLDEMLHGELHSGPQRVISGPVFSGHQVAGPLSFLGAYHQQISVIPEGGGSEFLGWLYPHFRRHSVTNALMSRVPPRRNYIVTTNMHGGERPIIPLGVYEKVMPLDILPTPLLRALAVDDSETAEKLGCLELVEEDIALLTYVCPSKISWGPILRRNLSLLDKQG